MNDGLLPLLLFIAFREREGGAGGGDRKREKRGRERERERERETGRHSAFPATLRGSYCYYLHFTDVETGTEAK